MPKRTSRRGPAALRAERARRRKMRLLAISVALVVAAAGAGVYVLTREDPRPPEGMNVAEGLSEGPPRVVFADFERGARLREHLLDEDRARDLVELPRSGDLEAAPGASYVSIAWWDEEMDAPRVSVLDPRTGGTSDIDAFAEDPVWHASGELLAYSEPAEPHRCSPDEGCEGDARIRVFNPRTGEDEVLVEAGPWFPRFWAGDRVLYQDEDDAEIVYIQGWEGERAAIDVWAPGVLGASPDGRWFFVSWEEETAFYPLAADGSLAGDPVEVEVAAPDGFAIAAWSHDSTAVVGASGRRTSELVRLTPGDPEPVTIAELRGRVTRLGWSPDNRALLVTTATDRFDTRVCPAVAGAGQERCQSVFHWTSGRAPLRMEGSLPD